MRFSDPVRIDTARLNLICDEVGLQQGEAVICTAMEDVAALVQTANKAWAQCDLKVLEPTARQISGIADRIGLVTLGAVATGVAELCKDNDDTALSATVARMVRMGEQSLIAIWEAQDLSV